MNAENKSQKRSNNAESRYARILDAIDANIAVLDSKGVILCTNKGWRDFAARNPSRDGSPPRKVEPGANYLDTCATASGASAESALRVYEGIRAVLDGRNRSFSHEYPCHSPDRQRWFLMKVKLLPRSRPREAVVTHIEITDRYLAEITVLRKQHELNEALKQLQEMAEKIKLSLGGVPVAISPSAIANSLRHRKGQIDLLGSLSKREMDVLSGLMRGERNSAMAARLNLSTKSVSTYRSRIFEKLKVESTAELVALISRSGGL